MSAASPIGRYVDNKFVIWDLDNCLADDAHRVSSIDWQAHGQKRWEQYHSDAILDTANHAAVTLFRAHEAQGHIPIIFTGRPERYRADTEAWLEEHVQPLRPIITMMRAPEDTRESTDLKLHFLKLCIRTNLFKIEQVVAAFDDRKPIIAMYKHHGIQNAQLLTANHLCAYTNPKEAA